MRSGSREPVAAEGYGAPMFEFGAFKLLVIALVALVVVGPKELPRLLRQTGEMVAKLRRMAGEFQQQFSDALRESELDQIKKDVAEMAESAKVDMNYDMVSETNREIVEAIEGKPGEPPSATSSQAAAPAEAAKAAIVNPTPENDVDSVFVKVDIPKPVEPVIHAPVREIGLDAPAAKDAALAQGQNIVKDAANVAPKNVAKAS
ncbi:MAG: twin-arginine translocase subunit TatB [Alphaproteobacteria bacterium]|nr:twin-arginine translocase subunit TatB [Alphaproteobacteria bacterium]